MAKAKEYTGTVASYEDAMAVVQELRDELDEARSNMEEKFSQTERYARYEEAVDQLGSVADETLEDLGEDILGMAVKWYEQPANKRGYLPRRDRLQNAINCLTAVSEELQAKADEMGEPDGEADRELQDNLEAASSQLSDWVSELESVEFPGFTG